MHSMQMVLLRLAQAVGTTFSNQAVKLIKERDYTSLVKLEVTPHDYKNASAYLADAQVVALFRKLEGLPTEVDLQRAAVDAFFSSEKQCADTNARLAQYNNWFERGFVGDLTDLKLYDLLVIIRKVISRVLGRVPQDLSPRLSGGSTYHDRGEEITIPHKMSSRPTVTSPAWGTIADLWKGTLWWHAHDTAPEAVLGNRFTTVPKDSRKDRGICIEPSLNVAYQLAVGSHIEERIAKKTGILIKRRPWSIKTAQETHRDLAQWASVNGSWSTIDLSNASDTVSIAVVKLLLPSEWFDLLSSLRSPYTLVGNKWIKLHKFSSMGNGFTFELETLLFYGILQGLQEASGRREYVSVYGDDIILPTVDSDEALKALRFFGFTPNEGKCHVTASDPFRESCGGDFFSGTPVRPVFLKKIPANPLEWMDLHNQIVLMNSGLSLDSERIAQALKICVNMVPSTYRLFGPSWVTDGCFHTEDRTLWRVREHVNNVGFVGDKSCLAGYKELSVLCAERRKENLGKFSPRAVLASALLGTPSTGPVPRGGPLGFKKRWRPTVM